MTALQPTISPANAQDAPGLTIMNTQSFPLPAMLSKQERQWLDARDKLCEELAEKCTCTPLSDRPCDGLLAGGLCDDLHMGRGSDMDDCEDREDNEQDDLWDNV